MRHSAETARRTIRRWRLIWFFFFTLPLFLMAVWYRAAKELLRIKFRHTHH